MNLDWPGLARRRQTVVIYMGLSGLPHLRDKLRWFAESEA